MRADPVARAQGFYAHGQIPSLALPIKAPGASRGIAPPYSPTFFHASCTTFFTSLPKRLESPAICTVIEAISLN